MAREYKDSGIEWIGQIPKEWEVKKVKYVSDSINKGNGITKEEVFADGDTPCVRYGEIYSKYNISFDHCFSATRKEIQKSPRYFNKGDILFAGTGELVEEIGKNIVYLGEEPCLAGGDIIVLSHHQSPSFLNYALNCHSSQAQKSRNKVKLKVVHISASEIGDILIVLPSLSIQQKIADYLDKVCGEVDEMVALQETMIEELKAYKQSVITEAVTKGLNPNVPMRNSGIDWIGEIPEHWGIRRMKYLSNVVRGGSPRPAGDTRYYEGNIPFMKVADITKDENIYVNSCEFSIKEAGLPHTRLINSRTLLLSNSGATLGVPKINTFTTTFNDGIAAFLNLDERIDIVFAYYSLKARTKQFLESASLGIGQPNLNTDIIGNTSMLIPPLEEQRAIASYLDTKCSEIDSLIALKQVKIEELKEYKKSVIYEYVTGKKEVV